MPIKTYKPNVAARRGMTTLDYSDLTKKKPEKSLLISRKQQAGRDSQGKISVRHRGGGSRRHVRIIDFRMIGVEVAKVVALEYDPNRSAHLALLELPDKTKLYIIAPLGTKVGDEIKAGADAEVKRGHRLPLSAIPVGTSVHAIELELGKGAQLARAAGARAQVVAKEGDWVQVKLPSGEVRRIHATATATVGVVGNPDHQNVRIGSAGRVRRMGIRPTVRGKAMNPKDHPHGGGEAGNSIGLKNPKTPWGRPALGLRTRRRKLSNSMIVRGRKAGRR